MGKAADVVAIVVIGFTGPFSVLLAPAAWIASRAGRHRMALASILTIEAAITFWSIRVHPREHGHFGRFALFVQVMSNQVARAALQGEHRLFELRNGPGFSYMFSWQDLAITATMFAVMLFALDRGPNLLRYLLILGACMFVSATLAGGNWIVLGNPGVGERYFYVLGIAFLFSIVRLGQLTSSAALRWAVRLAALSCAVGIVQNWILPGPDPRFDYATQLARYDTASVGAKMDIWTPIGRFTTRHWHTILVKRP